MMGWEDSVVGDDDGLSILTRPPDVMRSLCLPPPPMFSCPFFFVCEESN